MSRSRSLHAPAAALREVLRSCAGVFAAFLLLIPCSLVRAGDGVGVDGLIGSLPQRRGPNGECLFNGLAASFVPLNGSFWSHAQPAATVLAFEGSEAAIRGSLILVRRESSRIRVNLSDETVAQLHGCDVDLTVDFHRLSQAGVNTYLQLPSSYVVSLASAASTNGMILSTPIAANARHYYLNLAFIVRMMGQLGLPDVEFYFADPQGRLIRARFSLDAGSYLRIQVS
jgi:hypothetical protein